MPAFAITRSSRPAELVVERCTAELFEAPYRVAASLADMVAVLGPDRRAVVCRELTKTYEQVVRGTLAELAVSTEKLAALVQTRRRQD